MLTVTPATTTVPVRLFPEFAAMLMPTVPLPLPLAPELIVIQLARLVAVQAQPDPAVTLTLVVLAPPPTDRLVGLTAKGQPGQGEQRQGRVARHVG